MQFSDYIEQSIFITLPRRHATKIWRVTIKAVEHGAGLWVECQELTNAMLQGLGAPTGPKTPIFFFPFSEIGFAITSIESVALDEGAFGV
jgi:hypothetical protein